MARVTVITSDLSGKSDARTYTYDLNGTTYAVDLTESEWEEFNKSISKFVEVSTEEKPTRGAFRSRTPRNPKRDLNAVREWARANGHEVSDRGRIAQSVMDAYDAAN